MVLNLLESKQMQPHATSATDISDGADKSGPLLEYTPPYPAGAPKAKHGSLPILGGRKTPQVARDSLQQLRELALGHAHVHIFGESGTGKLLAATLIHSFSERSVFPLVTIDCATHDTSSQAAAGIKAGQALDTTSTKTVRDTCRQAHWGTLILDDIDRMGSGAQAELLRSIRRSSTPVERDERLEPPTVRIVLTSHDTPQALLRKRRIRPELYTRLQPESMWFGPLRHCKADILAWADFFFRYFGDRKQSQGLPQPIMQQLLEYHWPGNLFELQNTIQRYVVFNEITFLHGKEKCD